MDILAQKHGINITVLSQIGIWILGLALHNHYGGILCFSSVVGVHDYCIRPLGGISSNPRMVTCIKKISPKAESKKY